MERSGAREKMEPSVRRAKMERWDRRVLPANKAREARMALWGYKVSGD
jgi:hypothetical protein